MDKFNPTAIVNLQNFLHTTNIERLKKKFISRNVFEEEQPFKIDFFKGIISYYSPVDDKVIDTRFETELKELLWKITNDIKSEIDLSIIKLTNKERLSFWNNIIKSFDYIEETHYDVISTFPICLKPSEEIKDYLKNRYQFPLEMENNGVSYFILKPKYSRNDLQKIHNFMDDNSYIDGDEVGFEDFYSVLNYVDTGKIVRYSTTTENMVCLLSEMAILFTNLKGKRIEESERFKTKSGAILSKTNYDSVRGRIKNKNSTDLNNIRTFFSKNFPK